MTSVLTILRILSDLVISFPQRIMSDKKITLDHFFTSLQLGNILEIQSLEKVIKLKSRLIDVRKPETNSISEIFVQHHEDEKRIYLAKDLNSKNIIELVQ